MKIQCNKCKHEFDLKIPNDVAGKRIKFKCKNKKCRQEIELRVPTSGNVDQSTIITSKEVKKIVSAFIEVIPNEITGYSRFQLEIGKMTIGRKSESRKSNIQLVSDDTDISRIHCSIRWFIDPLGTLSFVLKDEDSKNGVFVNGDKLEAEEEIFLMEGDIIKMGNTSFLFIPEF